MERRALRSPSRMEALGRDETLARLDHGVALATAAPA